jgi:methylenetetrahydrofolate reductase (NADPH)
MIASATQGDHGGSGVPPRSLCRTWLLPRWTGNTRSSGVAAAAPGSDSASVARNRLDFRYELLPFGRAESEARAVGAPLTLTVTCSPRQGLDGSLEFASRLARLGHTVVLHIAARMVRSSGHLDAVLGQMQSAGIRDVFLVGGDVREPRGPYPSALDLLGPLTSHPDAPSSVGIPGYPEGHPLIDERVLNEALAEKARLAHYIATQICFEPDAIRDWIMGTREAGIDLPVYVGVPGAVDRRRLLEISAKVGVGGSISYLRKQRAIRRWLGHPLQASDRIIRAVADTPGVAGFHFFTFNRLVETHRYVGERLAEKTGHPSQSGGVKAVEATYGARL